MARLPEKIRNTNSPSLMVTQATDDLVLTARSRLRYANHRRIACDTNVPTTNTRIVFSTWIITQPASYNVVGMVLIAAATVITSSIRTPNVASALYHVRHPYSA